MTNNTSTAAKLLALRQTCQKTAPLVHCITNPISINDCANIVLAAGGRPIMAEHPEEVAAITAMAGALAVNLGNITDVRLASMQIAGQAAHARNIPSIIDLVGVACSELRLRFAQKFIADGRPAIIKGNISELKALGGRENSARGIDAGETDRCSQTEAATIRLLEELARETSAVIIATGITDIITNGESSWLGQNGTAMLSHITGTGCMLNALAATYLTGRDSLAASLLAVSVLNISGELAARNCRGPGSFRASLLDEVFQLSDEDFIQCLRLERL